MPTRLDNLFFHYLLDRRLIGQGDLLDDGLANVDEGEEDANQQSEDHGRVLLEVEKQRREEKLRDEAREKAILDTLTSKLNDITARQVRDSLKLQAGEKLDEIINRPFLDILSISLYKNLSIKQLAAAVSARAMSERRLLELARSHDMAKLVGKQMPGTHKPSPFNTIGYMGLDNARVFAFLVTAKPSRMLTHEQFPSFQRKLWRYCLTTGFILRELVADSEIDPLLAFYVGILPALSAMLVLDALDEQFNEIKRSNLSRFRDEMKYKEYNALLDAQLQPNYVATTLPACMAEFDQPLFERLNRSLSQTRQTVHLVDTLSELRAKLEIAQQVAKVWMLERSKLASTEKLLSLISQHNVEISTELSRFASMKSRLSLSDYLPLVPISD